MVTRWSQDGHKMATRWSQDGHKMVTRWWQKVVKSHYSCLTDGHKIVTRWTQEKMVNKVTTLLLQMVTRWSLDGHKNSHYSLFAAWQPERQIRGGSAFRLRVGEGRKSSHSCHLNFMVTVNLISLGEFSVKMKVKVWFLDIKKLDQLRDCILEPHEPRQGTSPQ